MLPYCLFIVLAFVHSQPCQPQFLLQSVVQDTFDIINFQNTDRNSVAKYSYPYNRNFFITQPTPLISISGLNVQGLSSLNYLFSSQIQNNTLVVSLKSSFMTWKKASIWMILHGRKDISYKISRLTTIRNSNSTLTLKSTINAQNIVYFSTILGVEASPATQYNFQIQTVKIEGQTVNIGVICNTIANLTIQTIFFDSNQNQFAYGYQKIPVSLVNQFYGVWMEFAPVLYSLVGLNSFSFSGNSIQLDLSIDLTSSYLQISRSQSFSQLELAFFSIGQLPSQICAPCNNFISITGCQDSCPSNSYPYTFPTGGKTCRTCFQPLGLSVKNNECSCPNNQVYYQGNCYATQNLPVKCSSNQILIGNTCYLKSSNINCPINSHSSPDGSKCICDDGYEQYQSQCLRACPQRSTRTSFGICACNYGYIMNSSKLCQSICPPNSIYRQDFKQCVCNFNYVMVNGRCSLCPRGQFYNSATSSCVVVFYSKSGDTNSLSVCRPNQIQVNGQCQCDKKSIKINGNCVACPQSTFKSSNQCLNCTKYCNQCQNSATCSQCQAGFNLNNANCEQICGDGRRFTLQCDDGNTQNGDGCSSSCKIQQGFLCAGGSPISTDTCQKVDLSIKDLTISVAGPSRYESCGIFTTFDVNPPIVRTNKELHDLFRFAFSNGASPKGIIINQNQQDPSKITVFFDYKNSLVNAQFKVLITVQQIPYGSAKTQLFLDTLSNPITSALADNYRNRKGNILQ